MNSQECRNHPLNNSGTKYSYKFGKSNRFKTPRLLTHSIYQIHNQKSQTRACGFGFGQRPRLASKNQAPSPLTYNIQSTITKKAKSFGSSREDTKFQSFLLRALKSANSPGPNTYNFPASRHQRKFSLGGRLPTEIDLKAKTIVPPPNAYNLEIAGSPATGKYSSSKHRNIRKIIFFGRQDSQLKPQNLGPGSYNIRSSSLDQSYFRSTCKNFGSASRPGPQDKSKKFVPGPGVYQSFSEFSSQFRF